jgi:hypothetical protein
MSTTVLQRPPFWGLILNISGMNSAYEQGPLSLQLPPMVVIEHRFDCIWGCFNNFLFYVIINGISLTSVSEVISHYLIA